MRWLERLCRRYLLRRYPLSHRVWNQMIERGAIFTGLTAVERAHLRELTTLFVHRKNFIGTHGLEVSPAMAVTIAAQACLMVLKIGLEEYDGWSEIIIYPRAFRVSRNRVDQMGLMSAQARSLTGEAWLRGPVILSWDDVAEDIESRHSGQNVVIHEFAHKLDMRNGAANGMPPLPADMVLSQWTQVFTSAYEQLQERLLHHHNPAINSYAATDPAEFFAVVNELFFTTPHVLQREYPAVYQQLTLFYRQHPAGRITGGK